MRSEDYAKAFGTIKDAFNSVRHIEGKKKIKIVIVFFAIMIAITIVSRITYQFLLPEVEAGKVEPGVISHAINVQGNVKSISESPVFAVEGLMVESVDVREGQEVNKGDKLYTVQKESVDQNISDLELERLYISKQIKQMKKESEKGHLPAEIYSLQNEITKKDRALYEYRAVRGAGYAVCAPQSGTVTSIKINAGEKTQGAADIILADDSEELVAEVTIPNDEEGAFINNNSTANVSAESGKSVEKLKVMSVSVSEESETILVCVLLPQKKFYLGQTVNVELMSASGKYAACVPRMALNMEGNENFVYLLTEEETILGKEYTAKKAKVNVLDKNRELVAVEGVPEGQLIIFNSDKIISEGSKVRKTQ